jgi:hypothetical protein
MARDTGILQDRDSRGELRLDLRVTAGEMVDRGRIELPTPGFSVPCIRLSWRGLPDLEPQTGTQWIHLLEPASAISRALRAWLREVEAMEEAGCPR